ncbi:MAG TPA: acetylxylan esterase [Pirellulales bacterium]|nr:acetylxylan esterase [Pirellulales bacterium]
MKRSIHFAAQARRALVLGSIIITNGVLIQAADKFPPVSELPANPNLPDPLVMLDGQRVKSKAEWFAKRRPELKELFQYYMYGSAPPAPEKIEVKVERVNPKFFGGKATKKEVAISYGPPGTPPIHLLLVTPNHRQRPAPAFVGINFCGNHALTADKSVALPDAWMPPHCPGCVDNRATDAGRGKQIDVWNLEGSIDRGYAVATFYSGDVDPDKPDFTDGVHPHYFKPGQTKPEKHDWGTIAAWAWGISRAVDYLVTDKDIDAQKIAVVGHSRLGKTALLAAAMDERIAMAIPLQAGCGGTAPSRGKIGEPVKRINEAFPHWFNDEFPSFNEQVEKLPFDQHCLVALVAPRPVLFANAVEDQWANPAGQFDVIKAADPVYRFLGAGGLDARQMPEPGKLVDSTLGYFIRPGKHSMTRIDWQAFWDFADKQFDKR